VVSTYTSNAGGFWLESQPGEGYHDLTFHVFFTFILTCWDRILKICCNCFQA